MLTGRVFNVQRFSVHDGPGIRTTVFLKGCPLACAWCHNPEGMSLAPEIVRNESRCIACGACHDGKVTWRGQAVFAACGPPPADPAREARCKRCHDRGDAAQRRKEFEAFAEGLPRKGAGEVDWEEAELRGRIRPVDYVEGQSIRRPPMQMDKDVAIASRARWMTGVLFSHRKHAAWNGCEACHPEIFPATKQGEVKYTMFQISSGEYCGVCHGPVAFPVADCERCHVQPVR